MKIKLMFSFLVLILCCKEHKQVEKPKVKNSLQTKTNSDPVVKKLSFPKYLNKVFVLGKFDYKKHEEFEKVGSIYASKTMYLNKEAYKAFIKMFNMAKQDGVDLKIISGTRTFYEQKGIWERKWKKYKNLKPLRRAKKILEYSSMPTTSRHHWGTDIDINNLNNSYFEKGKGKKEYQWLLKNANNYGFYQVYTNKKQGRTGYNLEKWHWSYMPLAAMYLRYYNTNITYKDICCFKGDSLSKQANMIRDYVNGISKKAKQYKE